MNPIFKKLQVKDHTPLLVINAPDSFLPNMEEMEAEIHQELQEEKYTFMLGFAEQLGDLHRLIGLLAERLEGDGLFWLAYPKKSSKNYRSDINRDSEAWRELGKYGYEGVRQIAIDADWSALRFRHVDFIKTMKRNNNMAMSEKGKKRTS